MASRQQQPQASCWASKIQISDELVCGHPSPGLSAGPPSGAFQNEPSSQHPHTSAHAARWWPKASSGRPHRQVRFARGNRPTLRPQQSAVANPDMRFNTELLQNSRSTLLPPGFKLLGLPRSQLPMLSIVEVKRRGVVLQCVHQS